MKQADKEAFQNWAIYAWGVMDEHSYLRAKTAWQAAIDHARSGEAALKVVKGEICYRSLADDQSFGMWCPISYDFNHIFPDGTKLFTHSQPAIRQEFDVRRIMLDVVPGVDGMGHEVYAKDTDDVVRVLSELWQKIEELQSQAAEQPREVVRVPDGWKLVPIDPTYGMSKDGGESARKYLEETGDNSPSVIYRAMLAAAPSPAVAGPTASDVRDDAIEDAAMICDGIFQLRAKDGFALEASAARTCADKIRTLKSTPAVQAGKL